MKYFKLENLYRIKIIAISVFLCVLLSIILCFQFYAQSKSNPKFSSYQAVRQYSNLVYNENVTKIKDMFDNETIFKQIRAKSEFELTRYNNMLDLLYQVNESLYTNTDNSQIISSMIDMLSDDEKELLTQAFELQSIDSSTVETRGKVGVSFHISWDTGYLTGNIASFLFSAACGALLGSVAMAVPPVALIVFVAGTVIGNTIAQCVNNWIISMGGDINYFYKKLIGLYINIPFITIYKDINVLDILFSLIKIGGGGYGNGLRPAGVPRPSVVLA